MRNASFRYAGLAAADPLSGSSRNLGSHGALVPIQASVPLDPRFADNPLVTGNPGIRFYAGVPLEVEEGSAIGALSVADRRPRTVTPRQLESLRRLAERIARELRLRRDLVRVSSTLPPADWSVGPGLVVADRWRISRELGRGGVGAVFEALDANGERAAIKVLLPEWSSHDEVLERFAREARVLMRLSTPHVGKLLDVGNLEPSQGGLPFLVLEYLEGTDLGRLLESQGPVPFRQAFGWAADACDGVAEAHALGVVHRDLKPSNVFLARTPRDPALVKVLDFGIAAGDPTGGAPAKLTSTRAVVGSPAYMSPEQMMAASEVGPQSDIWSMGVLLYELITGKIPFPGASALEIFATVMMHSPTPPREHLREQLPRRGRSRSAQVFAEGKHGSLSHHGGAGAHLARRRRLSESFRFSTAGTT